MTLFMRSVWLSVWGWKVVLKAEWTEKREHSCRQKPGCELGPTIGDNLLGQPICSKHPFKEKAGCLLGRNLGSSRCNVDHFTEAVHHHPYGIMASFGEGELHNKVH